MIRSGMHGTPQKEYQVDESIKLYCTNSKIESKSTSDFSIPFFVYRSIFFEMYFLVISHVKRCCFWPISSDFFLG